MDPGAAAEVVAGAPADAGRRPPAGRARPAAPRSRGALIQKRPIRQCYARGSTDPLADPVVWRGSGTRAASSTSSVSRNDHGGSTFGVQHLELPKLSTDVRRRPSWASMVVTHLVTHTSSVRGIRFFGSPSQRAEDRD